MAMRSVRALALLLSVAGLPLLTACADGRQAEKKAKGYEKADRAGKDAGDFAHVGDVNAEVTVLNVLHTLEPTAGQLEKMLELSARTMQKPPPRKLVKVSARFRTTLAGLRDA